MRWNQRVWMLRSAFLQGCLLIAVCAAVLTTRARLVSAQGAVGGVYVDPDGILRDSATLSRDDRLKQLQGSAGAPSGAVAEASQLRKISLRRLEAAVADAHESGKPLSGEILHLAGLQQVRYLFFYPEANDVVLAGPAEPWQVGPRGDPVGRKSGRPVLSLDDLIVALRYAFAGNPTDGFLGCSIEPTDEGMRKHAEFVNRLREFDRSRSAQIARGMEQAMGQQRVLVYGAPPSSRFALQMLAADYRLKRLALGHDPSPSKKVPSFLDLAARNISDGAQPQHRWWFVAEYDAVRHTADRLAWELVGNGLRIDTAPTDGTFVDGDKQAKPSKAATQFAVSATRGMKELIEKVPAFAELQNLVSLAVVSELIRLRVEGDSSDHGTAAAAADDPNSAAEGVWRPVHFLNESGCPIAELTTPKQTPSLANVRFVKERYWLFSTSGGVEITPRALVSDARVKPALDDSLERNRTGARADRDKNWWWD